MDRSKLVGNTRLASISDELGVRDAGSEIVMILSML